MYRFAFATSIFLSIAAISSAEPPVDFDNDIRPILSDRCFQCHGPDAAARKGDLRLDVEEAAKAEAIVPGDPNASELIKRITAFDPDDRMPPADSLEKPLSEAEVALLTRWIAEGANWTQHWAFVKPERPEVPQAPEGAAVNNAIDHFVIARLQEKGLTPAEEADRETLIRRLSFDLTGLPPTLEEIDAFVGDDSPDAYEKVVDRLLASPAYGERMALDWLDGARYADTNGYQNDFGRDMWPWRDWVIEAFNDNMPFDQFTIEQIAGDLLPNATKEQKVATGFSRNNRSVTEGGSIEEEWHMENIVDRVETTSAMFLGLSMGCARCHDHKYDPVSQKEFYEFFAFFNNTADKGFYNEARGNTEPTVSLPSVEQQTKIAEYDTQIAEKQAAIDDTRAKIEAHFATWKQELGKAAPEAGMASVEAPLNGHLRVRALGAAASRVASPASYPSVESAMWEQGLFGPSLKLDGSQKSYVNLGGGYEFNADKPFTVSIWTRPDGPGALYSKMDDSAQHRGFDTLVDENGQLAVHLIHQWPDNGIKVVTNEAIPMGSWSHVAVTYDGSGKAAGLKIYIAGNETTVKVEADTLNGATETEEPFRLGRRSSGVHYSGVLAQLRYHDRALDAEAIDSEIRAALAPVAREELVEPRLTALQSFYDLYDEHGLKQMEQAKAQLEQKRAKFISENVPTVMVMEEREELRPTYLHRRGEYDKPVTDEQLYASVPDFLPALPEDAPRNRLGLAQWLVSEEHPLTARVTVNRLWLKFFGRGIVKTQEDFGLQGDPPSHPKLLDWLATEFIANGWDLKAIQKTIVMSRTYRQDSALRDNLLEVDPENKWLARGPRFRLPAELIRDNALAVSGLLVDKIGGPSVKPYQPDGVWEELSGGASQGPYVRSEGEDLYRRSLYTYRKRTIPHPTLATFDAPSWEVCRVRRSRTNTPLQALALLNDTTYVEASRKLAERMLIETKECGTAPAVYGFRIVTGRAPNEKELEVLNMGLEQYMKKYSTDAEAARALLEQGEAPVNESLDAGTLAAHTALASVLLNLDEAITKE